MEEASVSKTGGRGSERELPRLSAFDLGMTAANTQMDQRCHE